MSLYSSREPFNDDPYPNVWAGHSERNQMRADTDMFRKGAPSYLGFEGNYVVRPRPEYNRPQNNPTNPILAEFRRMVKETGNGLYVTAFLFYGDLLEEWESHPLEQWHHAMDVLEKILRIYREES